MRHDWMIDVLKDLQSYARENNLGPLEADLTQSILKIVNGAEVGTRHHEEQLVAGDRGFDRTDQPVAVH